METIKSFTDLKVWQEGHALVLAIYSFTKTFPKEEVYSLTDQMRRSSSSVTANIAEGFGRQTYKEKIQFYYQAQGSLTELKDQLLVSKDIGYLGEDNFSQCMARADTVARLLMGLIHKTKSFLNPKS